jgi:signal transduction histidine kinase/DNA-binding response OmpR family regulator
MDVGKDLSSRSNVLVVDDRQDNLLALESTLSGLDAHIEYAASAQQALRYLLTNEVALILLDVQMPGVNGFELAELIRQRENTQHTPIIFISAMSTDEHYVFKGYSLGAIDYLTKPFEPEILKSKVGFFITLYEKSSEVRRQAQLLEKTNLELDELNAELENRVRERTAEIERASTKLAEEAAIRESAQARLALEHAVTRELAVSKDIISAAPAILKAFCTYLRAEASALWLLSEDLQTIACRHVETTKQTRAIELFVNSSLKNGSFAKGSGLPGVVWEQGFPVWTPLSGKDDRFPRAQIAAAAGFNSAIGMPIKMKDEFFGMIEFFSSSIIAEEPELIQMFDAIGSEIGQFVQRQRSEIERERLLAQEMTLRQQAERASRLKDEFLATVSHELRTPLNSILGWAQILRRGSLDDQRREAALETIFRNSRAQAQLIDDLLDMSRLITGNFPLELVPTSIRTVVDAAVEIVRPQAGAKSINLTTNFRSDDVEVTCDSERIQQIVWNLLVNAVKFTPKGGEVCVTVETADDHVSITVRDDGQGIAPDFLPHVFDRFRQADSTSTRQHRGLGLGLAIVSNLAELHGGTVSVSSDGIGHGAEFTLRLPLSKSAVQGSRRIEDTAGFPNHALAAEPDGVNLKDIRILVVEDDPDTAEMLRYALEGVGAQPRNAYSVSEAIRSLDEWIPNIILSDITMPDEDGYSLIKRVRGMHEPALAAIPAIALTAMARSEDGDRAISSGFQLHFPKPFDIDELTRAITGLLDLS